MIESAEAWARKRVETLPRRWQGRILHAWALDAGEQTGHPDTWIREQARQTAANVRLLDVSQRLGAVRMPLDATDSDVCAVADKQAERCGELAQVWHQPEPLRAAMGRLCNGFGLLPPGYRYGKNGELVLLRDQEGNPKVTDSAAIRRMLDPLWWRRGLRKAHAKAVEGAAIGLGYVNRKRDIYISRESLRRREQQNARNREALENTIATNEHGQEYTLAELAATGPANKAIRRAELMTRIGGFERIALDLGHEGLFFTVTCPSRMHKFSTARKGGGVFLNPSYDGTTPIEAQRYLAKVWARIRAALARRGVSLYGFRIAEPNHDGTPHWHLLVFHAAHQLETIRAAVLKQALKDSPDERGAQAHRVDFKPIDRTRGSAAGYIAKYVAKNIDGYKLETDLVGGVELVADGMDTARRVEAWAATWGIRQFQQVGGPPVGVWRELRRIEAMPADAPEYMRAAHNAVNKVAVIEGRENATVAWDHYVKAQGGVFCGRRYRVRLSKVEREGLNRYGEAMPDAVIGVEAESREIYTPDHMKHTKGQAVRVVQWVIQSKRYAWSITSRRKNERNGEAVTPWTCVNNCTGPRFKTDPEIQAEAVRIAEQQEAAINRAAWNVSREAGGLSTNEEKNGQSNPTS